MNTELRDVRRREFLKSSTQIGGGLVLALCLPACTSSPKAQGPARGGDLNAWLRIGGDDTITVVVDRSEMGQGVYTALPMLIAEELEVPMTAIQVVAAPVGEIYSNAGNGGQITGTSNSVQDAWEKLRTAGAQARMMLIAAAAAEWGVDADECHARGGVVVSAHGKTLKYGELAQAAAKQPVPKSVKLKAPANFTLIGRELARLDTPSKVDGSAEFGIDVQLPGMLHAALAQSPVLGGKFATMDAQQAQGMPGVRKILPVSGGVVVVAEHFWQALQARDALKIRWDAGANHGLTSAAIRARLKQTLRAAAGQSARADGDAAKALKSSAKSLSAVYDLPLLAHATMEPMNCTADVKPGSCDVYVGTQAQQMAQAAAAAAADLPAAQVRIHTSLLGGGFGRRLESDFVPAAVAASKAVGAPVKLIWTREDDMTHDYYRPPATIEVSGGLGANGDLLAWRFHTVSPSITARFAPTTTDPFDSVVEAAANYPYAVPNVAVSYSRQEVGIDVGYMRSVSHAINCFAAESFMDELASLAGKDPFAFRAALLHDKPRHRRVLEAVATQSGWGQAAAGRHQGLALMEGYTTVLALVAEISIDAGELKVQRIVCVADCGQMVNPKIVTAQIEGGIVFGLSSALWGEIALAGGTVQQTNFNSYRVARIADVPRIDVHLLPSDEPPGGIGEPSVALVAPAIGNAIHAATGKRIRALPIATQGVVKV